MVKLRFFNICIIKIPTNKYWTSVNDMHTEMLRCILKWSITLLTTWVFLKSGMELSEMGEWRIIPWRLLLSRTVLTLFILVIFSLIFKKYFIYWQRGKEEHQCVVASCVLPTGDLAHNPVMCPDWESNRQPFGFQACPQSTEPHQPGPIFFNFWRLLSMLLDPYFFIW